MKRLIIIALIAVGAESFAQCEWLLWADEFDGTELDQSKWGFDIGNGCPSLCGWGNNESQYYTDLESNVSVSDGTLKITANEEWYNGSNYTSGRIVTRDIMSFTSGRIEASIKLPTGQGLWPAFWLLPEEKFYGGWPLSGEIDIMENLGQDSHTVYGTMHFGGTWPLNLHSGESYYSFDNNLSEGFHEYAVEWNETNLKWFVDGVLTGIKTSSDMSGHPWRFDRDFHILLNLAVGGNWPGYPDASTMFPQTLEVDYVRIYQYSDDIWISGLKTAMRNSEVDYYLSDLEGATFEWEVTNGEIVENNGKQIRVLWGESSGTVSVTVDHTCTFELTKEVEILNPDCESILMDAQGGDRGHWTFLNGQLYNNTNPGSNEVNSSSNCHKYVRSTETWDVLKFGFEFLSDVEEIHNGGIVMAMDVYTNAPAESNISINLENHVLTTSGFPNGVHSTYKATTSVTNEWETLYFYLDTSPDIDLSSDNINQFAILFGGGTNLAHSYYFDNLRLVDESCIETSIHEAVASQTLIFPNPLGKGELLNIQSESKINRIDVVDVMGRIVASQTSSFDQITSDLNSGSYSIIIHSESGVSKQKLIIE